MSDRGALQSAGADWCLRFIEQRSGGFTAAALTDDGRRDRAEAASGAPVLSLSELDLASDAVRAAEHDYLAVLALRLRSAATDRLVLRFITPSAIRSASRVFGARWLVGDITVPTPPGLDEIALLVYRIRRTLRLERLLAAIESVIEVIESAGDDRDLALGRSALEHLEVLDDDEDAAIVVGGCRLRFGEPAAGEERADRFVAVVADRLDDRLWLTDRKLQVGPDRASARPVGERPYAVLRLGARSTRQSVREFIDEIRRRHQRRPGDAGGGVESFASFVDRELDKRRRELVQATYGHHHVYPVVTPIAIEVAANLAPIVELIDEPPSRFKEVIEDIRASIDTTFGIKVPGVRIRLNGSDLPKGTYLIMLDEVPLVSGNLDPEKLFCVASARALAKLPFDGGWNVDLDEVTLPDGSARLACVIPLEHGHAVRAAGFETLDASEYLELHLRSVITANLDMFVTLEHVMESLSDLRQISIRGRRGGFVRFAEIVRGLVQEQLPISPLEVLAQLFVIFADAATAEVAEELRLVPAVRARLTGDVESWRVFVLADNLEAQIRAAISGDGDRAILAFAPELAQELLTAVRNEVTGELDARRIVLIVEDWRLRPYVRSLLVLEFPHLRVLARREIEGLAGVPPPAAIIAVEP